MPQELVKRLNASGLRIAFGAYHLIAEALDANSQRNPNYDRYALATHSTIYEIEQAARLKRVPLF